MVGFFNAFPYLAAATANEFSVRGVPMRFAHTTFFACASWMSCGEAMADADITSTAPKMAAVTLAAFERSVRCPQSGSSRPLSDTAAAAGIAWINSIGDLGGYIGPAIFGSLRNRTGSDVNSVVFPAVLAAVAILTVILLSGRQKRASH